MVLPSPFFLWASSTAVSLGIAVWFSHSSDASERRAWTGAYLLTFLASLGFYGWYLL